MKTIKINEMPVVLERMCESCRGEGGWRERGQWIKCDACGGDGDILTEFGRSILDLVWKHFDGLTISEPNK